MSSNQLNRITISIPVMGISMLLLSACQQSDQAARDSAVTTPEPSSTSELTAEDARKFVEDAQRELEEISIEGAQTAWVYQTYINQDTQSLAARVGEKGTALAVRYANEAARFRDVEVDADLRRKLDILGRGITLPAPQDPEKNAELADIVTRLDGMYGTGEYCRTFDGEQHCMALGELEDILKNSRDPDELLDTWNGWRTISPPMKALYEREVELANEGAQGLGFANVSELWRSNYDMDPDAFSTEMDRLWGQVKPLYEALHCHVRSELNATYGDEVVETEGAIPAHLFGNMWAQQWGNIYDIAAPEVETESVDVEALLKLNDYDEIKMVKTGEAFFSSLGFEPLPETFWERSQFVKPRDREVVCHASAWDLDNQDDIRIKMCIKVNGDDFSTIHHELGHNYYQRAYKSQPFLYLGSANDGFHEAVGDTIALSITPEYLNQIGLLDTVPDASDDIGLLLRQAMDKVAFLPFGLLVDQWRWRVFNGDASPAEYNNLWWELRERYQGIKAPNIRPADAFDPGAKYHVPGNTPYARYFLAHILQFQFHRALCEIAGNENPVHRCSIYGSKEAGRRLNTMLEMGLSKPWPDALETLTGSREMDATAILDYFAPLKTWLDEQNQGRQCGW